jgi:hypothetical protein
MKVSTKQYPIGKPQGKFDPRLITIHWHAADLSPLDLVNHITAGMPFAIAHFLDGYRKSSNFIASELIAIDVDGNENNVPLTTEEYLALLQNPFVQQYAFAVIQTASSQDNAYKCRVLFRLSETITDAREYKALVTEVMRHMPYADPAAKDAARAFFGGKPGRPADFLAPDNCLDVAWLHEQLRLHTQAKKTPPSPTSSPPSYSDPDIEQVREALRFIPPILDYDTWVSILMAVHSAFPGADGVALIEEWSPGTPGEVERKFASFTQHTVTLGTLFHIAKQHGYRFPKKPKAKRKKIPLEERVQPFDLAPFTAEISYDSGFISEEPLPTHPTVLVKSPMGTGKTEWITHMVKPGDRVLVIVHRISLARSLAQRLGIPCYLDLSDDQIRTAPQLVICLNSLPKLVSRYYPLRPFDLVIMDELTQLHEHLGGDTFTGLEKITTYKVLEQIIKMAHQVIGLDAGMHDVPREWLASLRGEVCGIVNHYRPKRPSLTVYGKTNRLLKQALKAARNGTIAIACSYEKSYVLQELFAQQVGKENVRVINKDTATSPEGQDFLTHINKRPLPQVLIYTPSMGSGFDVTQPVDAVFGLFEGDAWYTAPDAMQMLGRFRQAHAWHVYIQPNQDGKRLTDWEAIYERYLQAAHLTALDGNFNEHGLFVTSPQQEQLDHLLAKYQAEANRSTNNLLAHFVALAVDNGHAVTFEDGNSYATGQAVQAAREKVDEAHKQLALTVDPVDDTERDWYRHNGELTDAIRAGNDRYHIEQTVGQDITPQIYDHLHTPRQRHTLVLFTDLRVSFDTLQQHDRDEADERSHLELLKDRRHHSKRAQIMRALLYAVWGTDRVEELPERQAVLTEAEIVQRMQGWLETHGAELALYFDRRPCHSENPLPLLRWMLARVGLKLEYQRVRQGEDLIYVYFLNLQRLCTWLGYSDTRLAAFGKKKHDVVPKPAPPPSLGDAADFGTDSSPPT